MMKAFGILTIFAVICISCDSFFTDPYGFPPTDPFSELTFTGQSPSSYEIITDTRPVLSWNEIPGAVFYHLMFSSDSGQQVGSDPIIILSSPSYTHPTPLPNGQYYNWKIRAENAANVMTRWSSPYIFFLQWAPGDSIDQMSPKYGATVNDSTPPFNWNPVNDAVGYEISITGGNNPSISKKTVEPQYLPDSPLSADIISWKVRPLDKDGQPGEWSVVKMFTVEWEGTPQVLAPAHNTELADLEPILRWEAVEDAVSYQISLHIEGSSSKVHQIESLETSSSIHKPRLEIGKTYVWWVRAWDGVRYGPPSDKHKFSINWGAIDGINLEDNSTTLKVNQELSWNPVSSATKYNVQIAESTANLEENAAYNETSGAAFTPSSLTSGMTYKWRVRAVSADGRLGAWTRTRMLTVSDGNLTGMLPAHGSSTFDSTPTFTWDAISGIAGYEVQINNNLNNLTKVTKAAFTPSIPYNTADTLYWRVRAVDVVGNEGPWSTGTSYTLYFNDGAVSGMAPATGSSLPDATPTHTWSSVLGAAKYQIQLADTESQLGSSGTQHEIDDPAYTSRYSFGDQFFWRIRAVTDNGKEGPWTNAFSLSIGDNYVIIPAGTFTMGSPSDEPGRDDSRETQHEVTLTQSYYMSPYETTQSEWKALMDTDPSYSQYKGDNFPVGGMTIVNIYEYCNARSRRAGLTPVYTLTKTSMHNWDANGSTMTTNWDANGYRIPTEAEWEYAARGKTTGLRYGAIDDIAWYDGNSGGKPHEVGKKDPNAYGLYDMLGNIWEFCADWYGEYDSNPVTDPRGPSKGIFLRDTGYENFRPYRGGGFSSRSTFIRAAFRAVISIHFANKISVGDGIRLARNSD